MRLRHTSICRGQPFLVLVPLEPFRRHGAAAKAQRLCFKYFRQRLVDRVCGVIISVSCFRKDNGFRGLIRCFGKCCH
jgi:hypothetical protein